MKYLLLCFALCCTMPIWAQSQFQGELYGVVTNTNGEPMSGVELSVGGTNLYTLTDDRGAYVLKVPSDEVLGLIVSHMGYARVSSIGFVDNGQRKRLDFTMVEQVDEIEEVQVIGVDQRRGVVERIDFRPASKLSGASNSFENILKVLPGVHSSNELSSQYSVRGGSYDENLVYVNGVEIYKPMLTRTGQQEGLSFINPQLVSSVEFSTGGFGAEFGDKMSSVLNVGYKRPASFGGSVEASFMGASAACDFVGFDGKFSGAVGLRYKRATYLLGTLDTKGEYDPSYSDIQAVMTYDFSPRWSLNFLGSLSVNKYNFVPTDRETTFGTLDNPQKFYMYYEGQEADRTENLLGALTLTFRPHEKVTMSLTGSAVSMAELERYDILGEYWLNQSVGEAAIRNDISDVGVGASRDHARNYTGTTVYTGEYRGSWHHKGGSLKWGLKTQYHHVDDRVSQWQRVDSAGYMVQPTPRPTDGMLYTTGSQFLDTSINAMEFSGFVQESYNFELNDDKLIRVVPGVRFNYSSLSKEILISPRLQVIYYPSPRRDLQFYAAAGAYYQPAFYKEMKNPKMQVNTSISAQRSLHFTLGASTLFKYDKMPCKFTTEVYFKLLNNLVAYKQDNVTLMYDWTHRAKGYVTGIDAKLSAELIHGAESWISMSFMKASQDVKNDSYINSNGETVYPGYFPMPNDQRFNVSVMLQDYIFNNPEWRAYLVLNYGTSLPSYAPVEGRYDMTFRMPSYFRTDVGLTYVLFDEKVHKSWVKAMGNTLQSCAITLEALNLFDVQNTSSYLWVSTVPYGNQSGGLVAIPNYLIPFRLNAKLAITF